MAENKLKLADINILVKHPFPSTAFSSCECYYTDFIYPDIEIHISSTDIIDSCISTSSADIKKSFLENLDKVKTTFNEIEHFHIVTQKKVAEAMLNFDTILMHGSVFAKDGYAYMFTAASGVGKSTRTKLFLDIFSDAIVVNGDKPLIKITNTQAIACGTPWCGKEGWNTNTMVPLRAIFLLERAGEGETNSIEEIIMSKAFPFLLQQTYCPDNLDLLKKTLQLLKSLEGKVKIYKFRSLPTEESVQLAYETAMPR